MTDISKFAVKETTDVMLRDANDEPIMGSDGTQASITVHGPGSKVYVKAQSARTAVVIERMQKRGSKRVVNDLEENAEMLAAITSSCNGFAYGSDLEGKEMFRALYADPKMGFIAEQVNRATGDWSNFSKGSGKS